MNATVNNLLSWAKETVPPNELEVYRIETKYGILTFFKDEIVGEYEQVKAMLVERIEVAKSLYSNETY